MLSLIFETNSAVMFQRLSQIFFFCVSVHRLSAIGSPAKFITASNVSKFCTAATLSTYSTSFPSNSFALAIFRETTVNVCSSENCRINSLPISPVPPVINMFNTRSLEDKSIQIYCMKALKKLSQKTSMRGVYQLPPLRNALMNAQPRYLTHPLLIFLKVKIDCPQLA